MRRARSIGLGLLLLVAVPASAAARLPSVLTQSTPEFAVRPATIGYTGDGTGIVGGPDGKSVRRLGHIRWTTYDRHQAVGRGLVWLDDCTPSCAQGTFSAAPVQIHAFAPANGRFTHVTLIYTYHGSRQVDRRFIRYYPPSAAGSRGYWEYAIV